MAEEISRSDAGTVPPDLLPLSELGMATADDCALLDADGRIAWAGARFAAECAQPAAALIGQTLSAALGGLGAPVEPAAVARVERAGTAEALPVLGFQGRAGCPRWFQPVLHPLAARDAGPGLRALGLIPVDPVMDRLVRAERARDEFEARLNYDPDTGLPRGRLLKDMLTTALAERQPEAGLTGLMLVEIENADGIFATCGPAALSRAAREVAERLTERLPRGTKLIRTRDKEFAAILESASSEDCILGVAEGIVDALSLTVSTESGCTTITARLAIATTQGEMSAETLHSNARIALNFRDAPRRVRVRVFDPGMRSQLEARTRTRSELLAAIEDDQIEPFFQPQIRLSDESVIGFEVLMRWRHPVNGIMAPPDFLDIAEESGLLPRIDELVMRKAIAALAALRRLGHTAPRIALNCTGDTLRDPNFVDRMNFELDRHALTPHDLAVEILETVQFEDEDDPAVRTVKALKRAGFLVGIDDFGRGQASILHLVTFNADVVKLDRSLIRDVCTNGTSRTVVEATVALAQRLGMKTLAEGAETVEQIAFLERLGCHYAQGFGIAHPMPLSAVPRWLVGHARAHPGIRSWNAGAA